MAVYAMAVLTMMLTAYNDGYGIVDIWTEFDLHGGVWTESDYYFTSDGTIAYML